MEYVVRYRWNESRRKEELVRKPVRTVYGPTSFDSPELPERPTPKVGRFTRWAYDGCEGIGTEDLMRAPTAPARGLVRRPDRVRKTKVVRRGYIVRAETFDGAVTKPFGTVRYVDGPKSKAKAVVARPKPVELDGSKVVVLTPDQLAAVLRQTAGVIRMGEMD
jgi:hypothetical protein